MYSNYSVDHNYYAALDVLNQRISYLLLSQCILRCCKHTQNKNRIRLSILQFTHIQLANSFVTFTEQIRFEIQH